MDIRNGIFFRLQILVKMWNTDSTLSIYWSLIVCTMWVWSHWYILRKMLSTKVWAGFVKEVRYVIIQTIWKGNMVGIIVVYRLLWSFKVRLIVNVDDNDTVYIAHCYPYTYTKLLRFLKGLENDPVKKHRFQRKFLCLTESGNK